ncbi:MAG: EamA family transporter [Nitriliruptoraceae bacterium]
MLAITQTLPRGHWWWRAAVLGTLNIGAFFALLFVAAYRLPGGIAATLGAAQPLLIAGLGLVILGERPTRWRVGWGIAGIVGVATMVGQGAVVLDPVGLLAGFAGTVVMATGILLTERWGRPVGLLAFTGWQLTAGGLLLAPLALLVEGPLPPLTLSAVAGYAYLAIIGTLVAYLLWFQGLDRLPIAASSFLPLLAPAVATTLGWWMLGQSLSAMQAFGFALALASVGAAQFTPAAPKPVSVAIPPVCPAHCAHGCT